MITLYQYNELSEDERKSLLWSEGAFVGERAVGNLRVALYQLYSFYVEVYYDDNEIESVRSFCDTSQLEPYLKDIDITSVRDL
ncbi:hypothetical protein SAE01_44790 [Segetibacter aerophilus]|uniref:Uncharacterized protein n=1 Tax=Segetibacter aerophilus TaxID=670293 RepID=A0A512BJ54_9BACT|nr:hypothetical protein SAE01_44790 [Segetibacter aerophilus]